MSGDSSDPFVYPGTNILKNKFDIRDPDRLEYYEGAFTAWRLAQLDEQPLAGAHDLKHLQAIHRHLFQDIYPWAGTTREDLPLIIGKKRPNGALVT